MARRKSNRSRRNPVRKQGSQWAVIKPDGTVDLLLGDEKVARRLAAACGYDAAPAGPTRRKPAAKKKRAMKETAKTPSFYSTQAAPYSGDKRYRVYDTIGFEVDSRKEAPKLLKMVEAAFARMDQAMVDSANHYMMTGDTLSVFKPFSEFNRVYEESRLSIPKIKILIKRGTPTPLRDAVSRLQDLGKSMIPVLNAGEVQLANNVGKTARKRTAAPAPSKTAAPAEYPPDQEFWGLMADIKADMIFLNRILNPSPYERDSLHPEDFKKYKRLFQQKAPMIVERITMLREVKRPKQSHIMAANDVARDTLSLVMGVKSAQSAAKAGMSEDQQRAQFTFGMGMTKADARRNPAMLSADHRKKALNHLVQAISALERGDDEVATDAAEQAVNFLQLARLRQHKLKSGKAPRSRRRSYRSAVDRVYFV